MFTWNIEEGKLTEEKADFIEKNAYTWRTGYEYYYKAEAETSREDKIAFIDSYTDGFMSALIALSKKYIEDEKHLKHNKNGDVTWRESVKWLKANAPADLVEAGKFRTGTSLTLFVECNRYNITDTTSFFMRMVHIKEVVEPRWETDNYVNDVFHDLLRALAKAETEYMEQVA